MKRILFYLAIFVFGIWFAVSEHGGPADMAASLSKPEIYFPPVEVSPKDVRAVYMTAAVAGAPRWVDKIIKLIDESDRLNAVVINVKDGDGTYLGEGMKNVVKKFREAGIYPIARVVVFQDNGVARKRPELALRDKQGNLWASGGGRYLWVDPASREVWDGVVSVSNEAFAMGFKEVNFDYIRFPSDGDMENLVYPVYDEKRLKISVIGEFFTYLTESIRKENPEAVLSADLFAYSFLRNNGLGVGQRAGDAAAHFDVVSPMAYPSHYAPGNFDFPNPAEHPYEVILKTLESGKAFLNGSSTTVIRPWIQDFNMGAVYDKKMIAEEIRAIKEAGYGDTWMVWNPSNVYDPGKFE
jgi:hypothetical protein